MYPFHPCSTIGVSGCTGSGKTTWVFKFLSQKNDLSFENSPNMVLYCYNVYQALFENMKKKTLKTLNFSEDYLEMIN